jgi:hypothetical protein
MSGFIECSAATGVLKINNNMSNLPSLWVTHRTQYLVFLILSAIILGMTATVGYSPDAPFRRFLGKIDPLLSMAVAVLAGLLCFTLLLERGWRKIYEPKKKKAIWGFLGLTVFLAFNSIWIDSILVFPKNINILWPASLLFYPAIAFFVEILFHIIPLTLLTGLCYLFLSEKAFQKSFWAVIVIVALLEPTFQIFFMEGMPLWGTIAVGVNLFLFNILQLYTFKRFDFVSMFALRLVFYIVWHIIWGVMRLDILF